MLKYHVLLTALLITFSLVFLSKGLGQASKDACPVNVPIGSLGSDDRVEWLEDAYGSHIHDSTQVVGLGEVTHGGQETAAFHLKMIRYLVERKGYRNILLEYNDYILVRPFRDHMSNGTPFSDTDLDGIVQRERYTTSTAFFIRELFRYVEDHNANNPDDTLQVAGFDVNQYGSFFTYVLNRFIIPLDYKKASVYVSKLGQYQPDDQVRIIRSWFVENEDKLKEKFGADNIKWLDFHIYDMENLVQLNKSVEKEGLKGWDLTVLRDSLMALNVEKLTGSKKTVVCAHNFHIMYSDQGSMGAFLHKRYASGYYVILTDFSKSASVEVRTTDEVAGQHFRIAAFSPFASTAVEIANRFGIPSGIFFRPDLVNLMVPEQVGMIDTFGRYNHIRGTPKVFDSLVVFENITPFERK